MATLFATLLYVYLPVTLGLVLSDTTTKPKKHYIIDILWPAIIIAIPIIFIYSTIEKRY